jgi:hypothetical protein
MPEYDRFACRALLCDIRLIVAITASLMFAIAPLFADDVEGGIQTKKHSKHCPTCWDIGMLTKISMQSAAPQFTVRKGFLEGYIGVTGSATFDTAWAIANKYRNDKIAETDSYQLGLQTYLVEPEIGTRIFFSPNSATSPYINLGVFWLIPLLSESYSEKFVHYDTSGAVMNVTANTSSTGPKTTVAGLYEIGAHLGFGAQYKVNDNFKVFGEFAIRGLFGGAEIEHDYSHVVPTLNEVHNWRGGGSIAGYSATGYVGVQFVW